MAKYLWEWSDKTATFVLDLSCWWRRGIGARAQQDRFVYMKIKMQFCHPNEINSVSKSQRIAHFLPPHFQRNASDALKRVIVDSTPYLRVVIRFAGSCIDHIKQRWMARKRKEKSISSVRFHGDWIILFIAKGGNPLSPFFATSFLISINIYTVAIRKVGELTVCVKIQTNSTWRIW